MSEWLKYVHWYASKAQNPWVSLVLYIKRHIVQFLGRLRMKTNRSDSDISGSCMIGARKRVRIRTSKFSMSGGSLPNYIGWILGGVSGADGLVEPTGLVQPKGS